MFLLLSEGLRASSSLGACPNCGISDPVLTHCSRLGGMEPSCLGFSSPPADRHTPRFRGSALGTGEAAALQDETTDVALSAQEGDVDPGAPQSPAWAASAFLERGGPPFLSHSSRLSPGTGVTVNALHPGVARTELGRHTGMHNSAFSSFTLGPIFWLLVKSPQLAAQPSTYLAVAEELESVSGKYFDGFREKAPAPEAEDEEVAQRLWAESARLVGLELSSGASERGQPLPK